MIKKFLIVLFATFLLSACSTGQSLLKQEEIKKENIIKAQNEEMKNKEELILKIKVLLELIAANDVEAINLEFVNEKYGIYEVFVDDETEKLSFLKKNKIEEIDNYIESNEIKEEDVKFECKPVNDTFYGWNKSGVFLTKNIKNYLSKLQVNEEIRKIIENNSYELVITNNTIFYITKIEDNWYITLIDQVKTDCSYTEIQ